MSFLIEESKYNYPTISHNIKNKTLFIYGFWDLPPYQAPIVQTLLKSCKQCSWLIHHDEQHDIYNSSHSLYLWLKNLNHKLYFKHKHSISNSQIGLFDSGKPDVKTARLQSIDDELSFIVREIYNLLKENTYTIEDIAIVYPNQEHYMPLLLKKCQDYQLPLRTKKRTLLQERLYVDGYLHA